MKNYATFMALLCSSVAAPAFAQNTGTNPEAEEAGEEIVVTALKGNETAQEAPTTVVIVGGEDLARTAVVAVEKLQTVVPGIRIQQSPGGVINPIVRGIGTSSTVPSFEQSIGLFIDGIFAGHSREYSNALFDVDRVELLKGTQASVVGKGTSLGALSIVTRKAEVGKTSFSGSYGHEFELGGDTVTATANLPIGDTFAIRIAGLYDKQGGWIKNVFGLADAPTTKRTGGRISLRYQPNDALDWSVSAQYTEYRQKGQFFHAGLDSASGLFRIISTALGDPSFALRPFESRYTPRPGYSANGFTEPGSRNDGTKLNSTLSYDLGSATITSTTGYGHYKDAYLFDGFGLFGSPLNGSALEKDTNFSQELRIGSNGDGPFSYLVGAYYYYDKWSSNIDGSWIAPLPLTGRVVTNYLQKVKTSSLFGQLGYEVSDAFRLSGSLRYEHLKKTGDFSRTVVVPGSYSAVLYPAFTPVVLRDSKNYVTWSAQAQYFVTPDTMLYASYATGAKGFGFQNLPRLPADAPYRTERSRTAEVGAKIGLGGGSHLNLAGFLTRVNDYQIGVNVGGGQFLVFNDDLKSKGVEGELLLKVTPELTFNASATYADVAKRGTIRAGSIPGVGFNPKFSGLLKLDYRVPLNDRFTIITGADLEFRSSQFLHDTIAFNNVIGKQPGYAKLGIGTGIEDKETGFGISLFANNLFNKYNLTSAFPGLAPGQAAISEDRPRTIMLQITFKR